MARLSTYAIDGTPVSSDKLIGTDDSGVATKNYPLGTVAAWLKESGATAILGQNNFIFQTEVDPQVGRLPGTFSLPVVGGDGTPFSDITTLKFSITSSAGQYVVDYIASTVGSKVILGQLDDLNAFGVYALESFTQDPEAPTFYNAVLSLASGNGSLISAKSYGFATYSSSATSGGTWGGITGTITNQTDLVDYIDAEIAAIPTPATPTLQSVTDAGNTTTNAISTGTVTANNELHLVNSQMRIFRSSDDMRIRTGNSDRMSITDTGNVGIGTTAPIRELHVYSSTPTINPSVLIQQAGTGNASLGFSLLGSTEYNMGIDKADNNKFKIHRNYPVGGDGNVFTITGGNDVGIGTESPATKLQVATNNNNTSLALRVSNDHTAGRAGISFNLPNIFNEYYSVGVDNDRYFKISNGSSLSTNTRMVISPAGNVGIGTTAPSYMLDVSGTVRLKSNASELLLDNLTHSEMRYGTLNYFRADGSQATINGPIIRLRVGGNEKMRVHSDGNVGIGTTVPDSKVHISGTAMQQLRMETAGGPSSSGDTSGRIGDMAYDDDFFYIKTANGWGRVQLDFGF